MRLLSTAIKLVSPLLLVTALFGCSNNPQQDLAAGRDNYFQQNYQASFERIKKAASSGDPDAEYALGYMYYYGKGTDQDIELARSWIQKAASQGQPMAAKALAMMDGEQANVALNSTQKRQQAQAKTYARSLGGDFKTETVADNSKSVAPTGESAAVTPVPVAVNAISNSQSLLNNGSYTIQIMSSDRASSVQQFVRAHNLSGKTFTYLKNLQGKQVHVLVYGAYKTSAAAHEALKNLPQSLRVNKPWVKSVGQVKSEMRG